ncbi:MAG: putative RecB family exonuclease [Hyphomicrobiaceae bacterium]|jgi:putative RecB family exonuclease
MAAADTYSYSRVTTFDQCARRYRYRYVDGVKEGFRSIEAFMGQQVHSVIEWLHGERAAGRSPNAEHAVRQYCALWDAERAQSTAPVRVIREGMDPEHYRRLGADIVADFHRTRFVADPLTTVAVEKHFKIVLGKRFAFQGFIDRLARDESGCLHIIDYKTGARTPPRFEGKDAEQLEAYAVAMFADPDSGEVDELELVLEYLRSGKRLFRRIHRDECGDIERRLVARIAVAETATVFPPQTSPLCGWCGFNDLCEAYVPQRRRRRAS